MQRAALPCGASLYPTPPLTTMVFAPFPEHSIVPASGLRTCCSLYLTPLGVKVQGLDQDTTDYLVTTETST